MLNEPDFRQYHLKVKVASENLAAAMEDVGNLFGTVASNLLREQIIELRRIIRRRLDQARNHWCELAPELAPTTQPAPSSQSDKFNLDKSLNEIRRLCPARAKLGIDGLSQQIEEHLKQRLANTLSRDNLATLLGDVQSEMAVIQSIFESIQTLCKERKSAAGTTVKAQDQAAHEGDGNATNYDCGNDGNCDRKKPQDHSGTGQHKTGKSSDSDKGASFDQRAQWSKDEVDKVTEHHKKLQDLEEELGALVAIIRDTPDSHFITALQRIHQSRHRLLAQRIWRVPIAIICPLAGLSLWFVLQHHTFNLEAFNLAISRPSVLTLMALSVLAYLGANGGQQKLVSQPLRIIETLRDAFEAATSRGTDDLKGRLENVRERLEKLLVHPKPDANRATPSFWRRVAASCVSAISDARNLAHLCAVVAGMLCIPYLMPDTTIAYMSADQTCQQLRGTWFGQRRGLSYVMDDTSTIRITGVRSTNVVWQTFGDGKPLTGEQGLVPCEVTAGKGGAEPTSRIHVSIITPQRSDLPKSDGAGDPAGSLPTAEINELTSALNKLIKVVTPFTNPGKPIPVTGEVSILGLKSDTETKLLSAADMLGNIQKLLEGLPEKVGSNIGLAVVCRSQALKRGVFDRFRRKYLSGKEYKAFVAEFNKECEAAGYPSGQENSQTHQ